MNLRWESRGWAGIGRVRWDFGWLLLVLLFGVLLANSILPARIGDADTVQLALLTVVSLAGAIGAFLLHESAHSLVARRYGVGTSRVTMTLFGGVPEFDRSMPHPEAMFTTAAAGPAVNLFFSFASFAIAAGSTGSWTVAIEIFAAVNLLLGIVNLLPAEPLDGGRMLHGATWRATGNAAVAFRTEHRVGRILGSIAIVVGITLLVLGAWTAGLFAASLGLLLRTAAHARRLFATGELELAGKSVGDYTVTADDPIQRAMPVRSVARRVEQLARTTRLPVVDGNRLLGWIDRARLRRLPQSEWEHETVGSLVVARSDRNTVDVNVDAREALRRMLRERTSTLLVTDGDRFAGVLSLDALLGSR